MSQPEFEIRRLKEMDEIGVFVRIAHSAFESSGDPDESVANMERHLAESPNLQNEEIWAAFDPDDGRMLGGYIIELRRLHIGSARLPTGCIGAVAVAETERNRGIAAALMRNAVTEAEVGDTALLLLTGIPNFYHRFDYCPVLLENVVRFNRADIDALPAQDQIQIRPATVDDAETLLDLNRRYFHPAIGQFDHTPGVLAYRMSAPDSDIRHLLAIDAGAAARGYLTYTLSGSKVRHQETFAGDWPTLSALLQAYGRLVTRYDEAAAREQAGSEPEREIRWNLPPDSPLIYELAEQIPFRSEQMHHYSADWMARPGNLDRLIEGMVVVWSERLAAAQWGRTGLLNLVVEGRRYALHVAASGASLLANGPADRRESIARLGNVSISRQALTQLCFGYRSAAWLATRPGEEIPESLLPLISTLFPRQYAWITGSDYF